MRTLLIASEADEGMGHVLPWASFVEQAVAQGYQVHMAAPDVGVLKQHMGARYPIHIWQSPRLRTPAASSASAAPSAKSWPELLVSLGYADTHTLQGAVDAWRTMLRYIQPMVVLADYAPALVLAAHSLDIAVLEVGGGFCVPPLVPVPQSFPGIHDSNASALEHATAVLVQAYNACLGRLGKPVMSSLSDTAVWPVQRMVLSAPELDPYGPRTGVVHAGALQGTVLTDDYPPAGPWPAVVGYLKPSTPAIQTLLARMADAGISALIHVPGHSSLEAEHMGSVTITSQPFALASALHHADVYLSNGGLSGVSFALQHGVWPVLVPQQAEQVATARNLLTRGWGSLWLPGAFAVADADMRQLFAPRPRTPRFAAGQPAEVALFATVATMV